MELNWIEILKAVGITTGGAALTALVIGFIVQRLFNYQLDQALHTHENQLRTALETHKNVLQGQLETRKNTLQEQLEIRKNDLQTQLETHKNSLATALTDHKADLDQELETHRAGLQREQARYEAGLDADKAREERVRAEAARWADPIIDSVTSLKFRLENILRKGGYSALRKDSKPNPGWDITHDYFLPSTVFLLAQFFCWQRLLEESLGFDLFDEKTQKDHFIAAVRAIGQPLISWPMNSMERPDYLSDKEWDQFVEDFDKLPEPDRQVFHLEQRGIGETLIVEKAGGPTCLRYPAFLAMWSDAALGVTFTPLRNFLEGVEPDTRRWMRLELVRRAVGRLEDECRRVLAPWGQPSC